MNKKQGNFLSGGGATVLLGILLIAGAVLIAFSLLPSFSGSKTAAADESAAVSDEYIAKLESRAASLISKIEGVDDVSIFLTLDVGAQVSYNGSNVSSTKAPVVRGVAVVCRGGDSPVIAQKITELLCALFDLSANHIYVSG